MAEFADRILESHAKKICAIAAPGSGKTRDVLIPMARRILGEAGVDPLRVLLLTFSRLSAIDLKEKAKALERVPRASTVHSYCLAFLLSEDNHEIRKRVESIILDFEKEVLLSDLRVLFPDRGKRKLRKDLEEFSAGWATRPHDEIFGETAERQAFKAAVVNWLGEHEAAMMEEIVYFAVDLAKKLPAAKFIEEPQYILVDEFQDLNKLEQQFIEMLAAKSKLLLVAGDPDQSIYSFKFAYPAGIQEFAAKGDVEVHRDYVTKRCPRRVVTIANQLLRQGDPTRTLLLRSSKEDEGEVRLVQKDRQAEEFDYVLRAIAARLKAGTVGERVIVLVPRNKLGMDFVQYAQQEGERAGVPAANRFAFVLKPEFSRIEQEKILLFGLLARPGSLIHARAYLGLPDAAHFAEELRKIKEKYGNLRAVIEAAKAEDFPASKRRLRALGERIEQLRKFVAAHGEVATVDTVLNELFPVDDSNASGVRSILESLREAEDTARSLYGKFIDYIRSVPFNETTIRVMTLRASKGLDADHVYILGCNAGNLPGPNRSSHMTDQEHREEQRRLLYVGVTRAARSLTISWSRHIPFSQSKGQYTPSVATVRIKGEVLSRVGISEFLQDLAGVEWER